MTQLPQSIRPTPLSEKTLVGALIGFNVNVILFALILASRRWPDAIAGSIVTYLGAALVILAFGNLVLVAAFVSPWIGTIKLSGMGVDVDIDGGADPAPPPPPPSK